MRYTRKYFLKHIIPKEDYVDRESEASEKRCT